ncbi:MAG: NUDIX hydrolase, partial [Gaiellaceae bacterium]
MAELRHLPHVRAWEKLSERLSYDGFRKILTRRFRLPDGREADFDIFSSPDTVAVLALTEADEVILVREFRPGPEQLLYELPGGIVEDGETPEEAARRELTEETGYEG